MTITLDEEAIKELLRYAWTSLYAQNPTDVNLWISRDNSEAIEAVLDVPSVVLPNTIMPTGIAK